MCKAWYWRWLFGNKIPVSLVLKVGAMASGGAQRVSKNPRKAARESMAHCSHRGSNVTPGGGGDPNPETRNLKHDTQNPKPSAVQKVSLSQLG